MRLFSIFCTAPSPVSLKSLSCDTLIFRAKLHKIRTFLTCPDSIQYYSVLILLIIPRYQLIFCISQSAVIKCLSSLLCVGFKYSRNDHLTLVRRVIAWIYCTSTKFKFKPLTAACQSVGYETLIIIFVGYWIIGCIILSFYPYRLALIFLRF